MRILVIDDERGTRKTVRTWLIQQGHDVHDAVGGSQAFQLLKTLPYDVVTLADHMVEANSVTMIDDIHSISKGTHVIVLSADANAFAALKQDLWQLERGGGNSAQAQRIGYVNTMTGEA